MQLKSLKLTNYRNYTEFNASFDELKTIIIGQNAQGKSNILEAINLLATSKSDRATRDSDLVFWDNGYALIFADIETKEDKLNIALQINSTGRRKLKINEVSKRAPQADLLGNFFAVMFSCEDLYLIKGSPSVRRDFLDSILLQLEPTYNKQLKSYQKAVTQKNALLKGARETGMSMSSLKSQLDIWNEQIIELGSNLLHMRLLLLKELTPIAMDFQDKISKGSEELKIIYEPTILKSSDQKNLELDLEKIKQQFKLALEASLREELGRGQCTVGPHRDDIGFLINERPAKSFASQGQQRSIVLAIKLAELKIIETRKNEIPVLLLDDVFAELDESRQDFLLHNLPENIQTFITTTHISDVQHDLLKGAQVFKIESGKVVEFTSA